MTVVGACNGVPGSYKYLVSFRQDTRSTARCIPSAIAPMRYLFYAETYNVLYMLLTRGKLLLNYQRFDLTTRRVLPGKQTRL